MATEASKRIAPGPVKQTVFFGRGASGIMLKADDDDREAISELRAWLLYNLGLPPYKDWEGVAGWYVIPFKDWTAKLEKRLNHDFEVKSIHGYYSHWSKAKRR